MMFPLSGPLALMGKESLNAAEVARDIINESGGLWGKKVEFVVVDTPDATAANTEVTRLIIKEGIKVIVGTYGSFLAMAASEVTEREGAIYWETISVANKITGRGYKYVFRLNHNATMMGETAVDYAKILTGMLKMKPQDFKVAVISEDSDFGMSVGDAAVKKVKALGMQMVGDERYSKNLTDLSSMVLKLKAAKPDCVIATSYLNDAIMFVKQSREQDFYLKALLGIGTGYALPDFIKALGKYADGTFDLDAPVGPKQAGLLPEAQQLYSQFLPRFKAIAGRDPGPLALICYGYTWALLKEVLPAAGSFDLDKIRAAALKLDKPVGSYPTGVGLKIDETGQNIRANQAVMQWQNQNLKVIWPDNLAVASPTMVPLPPWSKR
jgi:branched-chain amino acid transport system substrate-binding protein